MPDRISYIQSHMVINKIIKNALLSMTKHITSVQYPGASSVLLLLCALQNDTSKKWTLSLST